MTRYRLAWPSMLVVGVEQRATLSSQALRQHIWELLCIRAVF